MFELEFSGDKEVWIRIWFFWYGVHHLQNIAPEPNGLVNSHSTIIFTFFCYFVLRQFLHLKLLVHHFWFCGFIGSDLHFFSFTKIRNTLKRGKLFTIFF